MRFSSDSQRRAVFANMSRFSDTKLEGKLGHHGKVWRAETELGMFDPILKRPTYERREFDVALTEMPPEDFLKAQYEQYRLRHYGHSEPVSYEDWLEPDSNKVEFFRQILRGEKHAPNKDIYGSDSKLPIPVLVYDENGNMTGFQEGRHRGLAAKAEGFETIPVIIAKKRIVED